MPPTLAPPDDGTSLIAPTGAARACVAMLHGLGMEPAVLHPFLQSLALPAWCLVPAGPVHTGEGGRTWWAVDPAKRAARLAAGPSDLFDRHPAGRPAARAALGAALLRLRAAGSGLPLVLAGFSQGGMLALDHTLLGDGPRPDALVLLSSSVIASDEWAPHWARLRGLPVLLAHGRADDDLAFSAGERLHALLLAAGARVSWLPFDGGHQLPLVVWRALRRFVIDVAAPAEPGAERTAPLSTAA